ncbi:RNA polymerase sigma factor (sigma-70 family) [Mucilaginibacter frigoritolerans]|uniref:RNA polymerase sigma factor (Sigma-70 family) n=1 Tax=Mucilaginibacter frigoritolerans TaxID=652788 RepID=A0A562UFQ1_9SPHI|nr:RNA polymerase sigma factor [Mucilaginibacter frigoritolerans]TWJ04662.1 RNA polymerase sigma factor (sigma-70 family) [Mucilaginibacter frigoritolerans]
MTQKTKNIIKAVGDYGKGLFNFIRGKVTTEADAEDILQDVWVQLSNITDTDDIDHLKGWLFRVARNKIIDRNRKNTEQLIDDLVDYDNEEDDFNFADILLTDENDPESLYLKELFWDELFAALDELPQKQREVFVWNELEDKTLQQIADETGENLKTIISRKGYAVKYLRSRLQQLYNEFLDY